LGKAKGEFCQGCPAGIAPQLFARFRKRRGKQTTQQLLPNPQHREKSSRVTSWDTQIDSIWPPHCLTLTPGGKKKKRGGECLNRYSGASVARLPKKRKEKKKNRDDLIQGGRK